MGVAKLNVWVKDTDFPCKPDIKTQVWFIDVILCDGTFLNWCGKKYYGVDRTVCGHVEIEVPPGCYVVRGRSCIPGYGNFTTDMTMVTVSCGDTACVQLVPSGFQICARDLIAAIDMHVLQGTVTDVEAQPAIKEIKAVAAVVAERVGKSRFSPPIGPVADLIELTQKVNEERAAAKDPQE